MDARHVPVIEGCVRGLGEIADPAPGNSGSLSLDLGPGHYVVFCNQPGHYRDGMSTKLIVVP